MRFQARQWANAVKHAMVRGSATSTPVAIIADGRDRAIELTLDPRAAGPPVQRGAGAAIEQSTKGLSNAGLHLDLVVPAPSR